MPVAPARGFDEKARRDVWVCGAGAYVVLKALAFDSRGENKDAYDLFYILRNYGAGVEDVVARLQPLLDDQEAEKALDVLRRDFNRPGERRSNAGRGVHHEQPRRGNPGRRRGLRSDATATVRLMAWHAWPS